MDNPIIGHQIVADHHLELSLSPPEERDANIFSPERNIWVFRDSRVKQFFTYNIIFADTE